MQGSKDGSDLLTRMIARREEMIVLQTVMARLESDMHGDWRSDTDARMAIKRRMRRAATSESRTTSVREQWGGSAGKFKRCSRTRAAKTVAPLLWYQNWCGNVDTSWSAASIAADAV